MKRRYNELLNEHLNEQDLSPLTIPEIRCNRHFYGAILCANQAQAPINEGIVAIEPCAECISNADEAQSQVRSLETDVRILRSQLDEAVALLRRLHGTITCVYHGNGASIVNTSAAEGTSDSPQKVIYLETGSFLSRLDGGEENAMTHAEDEAHRTPILGNVIAHDCITFRLQGRDIPLQMLQSARDEAESYRERMIALTAHRDALQEALTSVVNRCDSAIKNTDTHAFYRIRDNARAALALAAAKITVPR